MRGSSNEFSMLAKLRVYDDKDSTVTLSPMFSIPKTNLEGIHKLEQENTKDYSSKRILGLIPKPKEGRVEILYDTL